MSCQSEKRARAEAMLGEAAELALMLARGLAVRARECEDTGETAVLVEAFHKTTRAMRLTLALDLKLERQAARDAADEAKAADAQAADAALRESRIMQAAQAAHVQMTEPTPAQQQKRRVREVLNRLLWDESEGDPDEYDILVEDLDVRLQTVEGAPGFADLPIEVLAEKLKDDMRLCGELVVTTAATLIPLNGVPAPADTG